MGETRNSSPAIRGDGFGCGNSDAVYIDTNRILDSCRDKDCIEDLRVYLTQGSQKLLESAVGDHLHFSVTHNDEPMDPVTFLELD
mgnify:CR=1 FL=1